MIRISKKFVALTLGIVLLVGLVGGGVVLAAGGNGAQHGYVELTVADADGNQGPSYLVRNETELWVSSTSHEWYVRTMQGTGQYKTVANKEDSWVNISGNKPWVDAQTPNNRYRWVWENWSDLTATGNTIPGAFSPNVTQVDLPSNTPSSTGDSYKIQYQWTEIGSGEPVLVSTDITTYDITLYINAWGAMESWMSNKNTFPAPLGKYSFSISSLERVTAASWSVTKNGELFAGGDLDLNGDGQPDGNLLGNLALEGPANYLFPPAHEGVAAGTGVPPDHGAGFDMNYIQTLDSTLKNDLSGGNRVVIVTPPSFTLDTDTAVGSDDVYAITVTMTIKDGETGTSVTKYATATVTIGP